MVYANVAHEPLVEAIHTSIRQMVNGSCTDADNQRSVPECAARESVDNSLTVLKTPFSAAFSSLCQSVIEQNASMLEKLLTDMLVPLLGDWLDKNLPSVVERLIGEEIERITQASEEAPITRLDQVLGEPRGPVCSLPRIDEGMGGDVNMDLAFEGSKSDVVRTLEIDSDGAESSPLLRHPARVYTEPPFSSTVEEDMRARSPRKFGCGPAVFRRYAATMLIFAFFSAFLSAPAAGTGALAVSDAIHHLVGDDALLLQAQCEAPSSWQKLPGARDFSPPPVTGPIGTPSLSRSLFNR